MAGLSAGRQEDLPAGFMAGGAAPTPLRAPINGHVRPDPPPLPSTIPPHRTPPGATRGLIRAQRPSWWDPNDASYDARRSHRVEAAYDATLICSYSSPSRPAYGICQLRRIEKPTLP